MAGFVVQQRHQSRQGRQHCLSSLNGTWETGGNFPRAINGWVILGNSLKIALGQSSSSSSSFSSSVFLGVWQMTTTLKPSWLRGSGRARRSRRAALVWQRTARAERRALPPHPCQSGCDLPYFEDEQDSAGTPFFRRVLSRKHVVANPALCAPACVGQASRLFPSKEIPSPFGGRPQAFETVAARRLFKVRDRRDACPTASFRLRKPPPGPARSRFDGQAPGDCVNCGA